MVGYPAPVFTGTFASLPSEDPDKYIKDNEIYGKKIALTDNKQRQRKMQAAFR